MKFAFKSKIKKITSIFLILILASCTSAGRFGTGVDITFDPRTIGMQIDDTIMQKNLSARLALAQKKYFVTIQNEVIDGRIFLSGKVDEPEEKIKITKMAWETKGVRSVKNAITIKGETKTINKNIYIFGIAMDQKEKEEVINEANKIFDVKKVFPSIYLVTDLSRNKL